MGYGKSWIAFLALPLVCLCAKSRASASSSAPGFYKDVLPILQQHCQTCHRAGEIAPMALVTYAQARKYAAEMKRMTSSRMMPPWFSDPRFGHFSNDLSLTPAQIATIADWADAGAPAGNPRDASPTPRWAHGWNIPKPDVEIEMSKAVTLPAHGDV